MCPSKLSILLLLISHFSIAVVSQSQYPNTCNPHDKKVLLRIKRHLGNPACFSSWDSNDHNCGGPQESWGAVEWDEQGYATTLTFRGNDIHFIPPFLDRLPKLVQLYFSDMPNLTNPVPAYIGNLTKLYSLSFNNVSLSGPYPDSLGRLKSLYQLIISQTNIQSIPNFISNLTSLSILDLSENKLTGPIPTSLGRLSNLKLLLLNDNKLSGSIPSFLGERLVKLVFLNLEINNFSGTIPASLGQLAKLDFLSLGKNRLSGPIPMSLGRGKIDRIHLGNNKLTGDASFLIDKKNNGVVEVDISNNQLMFDFTNVELAPRLYQLNISHNRIYGRLPKLFYRLGDFLGTYVDITYNELCGPIPNGRYLKKVNPKVFAHNKCLCGGPLSRCK